MIPELR